MKTVSVIIPFYSNLSWLCEAVDSVLCQTYPIHEIILVNDGSKENMTDFLSKYGEKIIYIYQENSGAAAARNTGIKRATGDYVAFQDSDDIWLPTKIEKQMSLINATGVMWCHCGFNHWNPETNKRTFIDNSRDYDDIFLQRHITTAMATPGVIINREIYKNEIFLFPVGVTNGEDDKTWTKIAKYYKIGLVQEPLVDVRIRRGNSYTHVIERFHLRVSNYRQYIADGESLAFMVHFIYMFYRIYARLFGYKTSEIKEWIAKCFWSIPYVIERVYIRYIFFFSNKDKKYIVPFTMVKE